MALEANVDDEPAHLPLDAWHRAHGARMVPFAGYAMPVQYEGIVAEHEWTRRHAGLFDVSHMGQLFVSGEGAEVALEALLPIDLSTLELGALRYSLLLDDQGGILDDLIVARWRQGFFMVVNGATKHADSITSRIARSSRCRGPRPLLRWSAAPQGSGRFPR